MFKSPRAYTPAFVRQGAQKVCCVRRLYTADFRARSGRVTPQRHSVGMAHSPLRAGVGYADPTSRFESYFPRPYRRGYGTRRFRGRRRPAAKMAARQSAQRRRESVGRAVHCAPELVVQSRLLGLNLVFRALTSTATAGDHPGRKKLLPRSAHLECTAAKMAALQSAPARDRSGRRSCCAQDGRASECNNRRYCSRRRETAD